MRFILAFAVILSVTQAAAAALTVCNKTAHSAKVALGRFDGKSWMSEGWWRVAAGKCARLIDSRLEARFYYLYATDGAQGTWDGAKPFCTGTGEKFAIAGRGACLDRGYDSHGFFEIDTGNRLDWTQTLSD